LPNPEVLKVWKNYSRDLDLHNQHPKKNVFGFGSHVKTTINDILHTVGCG
jgi:hypothetical protein